MILGLLSLPFRLFSWLLLAGAVYLGWTYRAELKRWVHRATADATLPEKAPPPAAPNRGVARERAALKLDSLAKHGYADDTLFAFTADQGAQFPFAKWNLYDAGIRAPLIVRWPGKVKAGAVTPAMVSLVDLLPTVIEAAGGKTPERIDGRSFLAVLLGKGEGHRERVFAAHTGDGKMNRSPMRCVRTSRYKYILNLAAENVYETVRFCKRTLSPDRLKGFLHAPWRPTLEEVRPRHMDALANIKRAREIFET